MKELQKIQKTSLERNHVKVHANSQIVSLRWLQDGVIVSGETKVLIMAAQDQSISTNYYKN